MSIVRCERCSEMIDTDYVEPIYVYGKNYHEECYSQAMDESENYFDFFYDEGDK